MNYQVIIESKVENQILDLDKKVSKRVIESIEKMKIQPRPSGCSKLQVLNGYRIRIGDIRVLYTIDDLRKVVTIYKVDKRSNVYKNN